MQRWDAFVEACPEATFFHRAGWKKAIEAGMGHRAHFLYAERNGAIEGVLPLGHVKSFLFGNALMSAPFCVYGGVAAHSDAARVALHKAAEELARRLGVDYLEMRNAQFARIEPPESQLPNEDWLEKELYVTFRKEIDADAEKNLLSIPRKQRAVVRKGIKAGLVSEIDTDIQRFYDAYAQSVRNLGTPVFPKKFFSVLRDVFGEHCEVLTVVKDGRLISSVMSFYFRDEVLPYYGGGTSEARAVKGNDFMYWELMRRAGERGIRVFDYGRSKMGTGSYSFKKNWGFEPEPLKYEYLLVKASEIPDVNPLNPKYQLFINAWKRLPLPVSKFVGPFISRNLG
ncbi:MAG TPA: FemAB family PEP-CTERM system-associated protein [Gammaproteobacteria bacterium]|nr:FemAB family PEP-CTERM system-associated protein [Gammaproteobacteria bacterium]